MEEDLILKRLSVAFAISETFLSLLLANKLTIEDEEAAKIFAESLCLLHEITDITKDYNKI